MVTSIASAPAAPGSRGTGEARASVALQDKLARCEQQLGDWQACPSRKTPEGKKIIEDLQTQIRNLETRISSTASPASNAPPVPGSAPPQAGGIQRPGGDSNAWMGRSVDVYA